MTADSMDHQNPTVLLIGGPSAVGKSTYARSLARSRGADWVQVDDLRLALQWSNVTLPTVADTKTLYFFEHTEEVWSCDATVLRDAQIAVGRDMLNAIAIVAANHVALSDPAVIEGDGILSSIVEHPELTVFIDSGMLEVVFMIPHTMEQLRARQLSRRRDLRMRADYVLNRIAEKDWLFGQWPEREAQTRGLRTIYQ